MSDTPVMVIIYITKMSDTPVMVICHDFISDCTVFLDTVSCIITKQAQIFIKLNQSFKQFEMCINEKQTTDC
jgi:hypothetical protein